ncbi:hypothetical protein [Candidatus Methylopumilus planktonicus]|uniref:hypothetical protein n=1 Tax=Candidatus Methylopumilus planktonicus TaxID=1581557 RepID=UPI003BEEDDF5
MKKIFILIFIFLSLILPLTLKAAACNTNPSGAITNTSGTCTSTPDTYIIHIYKSGLCNGIDPSSATIPNLNSQCVTTFDSGASPLSVTVQNGISSPLASGTITRPPNGTYTHGFVLIRKDIDMKAIKTLANTVNGSSSGSGSTCWTESGIATSGNLTKCGTSASAVGFTTSLVNNLAGSGNCPSGTPAFHCTYEEAPYDVTYAYLVTSSNSQATSDSDVANLLGFATFSSPITVSDSSTAQIIQFRVTQGVTLDFSGGALNMYSAAFKTITGIE